MHSLTQKILSYSAISCQVLFDSQTLELISQSLQPSQNRAKDPRGTPERSTSTIRRRPWNRQVSSRLDEALLDINPTCGVEAELGIQTATETALNWTYWKNRTAQPATFYSQKFCNHCKHNNTFSILFINWLSRWAQAKCCQSEKSKHSIIDITCHEQSHKTLYYLGSNPKSFLENRDNHKQPTWSLLN